MELKLFDTSKGSKRKFSPIDPPHVGMYACGPTVYNLVHIGNLRTYISEDILHRVLELNGYKVDHVLGITDISNATSKDSDATHGDRKDSKSTSEDSEIAEYYEMIFKNDIADLNIREPKIYCRASDHISEQIQMISCIEKKQHTYKTSKGIYLDTKKLDEYGNLARLDVEGLKAGARIDDSEKRHLTDFVLWKFSPRDKKRLLEWDSPWGPGIPGWHTECAAMSSKYLGKNFDIHCGRQNHIPVHHTNEIAQANVCYGTSLANYWVHGNFVHFKNKRMSKSADKLEITLQNIVDRGFEPLDYRYLCLGAHYRSKLSFSWESLEASTTALNRLRKIYSEIDTSTVPDRGYMQRFISVVNNDLNTPQGLALLWEMLKSELSPSVKKATMYEYDRVLGLRLDLRSSESEPIPTAIKALVNKHQLAKANKQWRVADSIRNQLSIEGYELQYLADGTFRHVQRKSK